MNNSLKDIFVLGNRFLISWSKTVTRDAINKGVVLKVGDAVVYKPRQRIIKVGDGIVFPKYAGIEIEYDGEQYLIMPHEDVLMVIR